MKSCFVIMPFTHTPTRNAEQLSGFFESVIKNPIENHEFFRKNIRVYRSEDDLNITNAIIRNIFEADFLIADLSGNAANPNVMYELGVRLGGTNKPVILIRESHSENKDIFDIRNLHTFGYDPVNTNELQKYIIKKLIKFHDGAQSYRSPVLEVLDIGSSISERKLMRRFEFMLNGVLRTAYAQVAALNKKFELLSNGDGEYATILKEVFSGRGKNKDIARTIYEKSFENKSKVLDKKITAFISQNKSIENLLEDVDIFEYVEDDVSENFFNLLNYYHFRQLAGGELSGEIELFRVLDFMTDTVSLIDFIEVSRDFLLEATPKAELKEAFLTDCRNVFNGMRGSATQEDGERVGETTST